MGGFSDNYECGYWEVEESTPKSSKSNKNKFKNTLSINKKYIITSDKNYDYLYFMLSPIELLESYEQDTRNNFFRMNNTETALEFKVNMDRKSIELYDEELYIGSLRKVFEEENINNTKIVDDFCFTNNRFEDLEAFWNGEKFYLKACVY